ncbi:diacylglycerol kinase [Shouchella clausii]|jgi:undecaprenol kinase|uniref:Diacylglycerol kinase n=1 Tax=Shouchella clausii TaxID=79880 RepID=A0A268S550_SHOCL|nr:diacylglycerol kinase family protein [Shouchella clausii]PAD43601.1 diacylglycerol kinase [Bacillus sp. 7520-S]SPU22028.1 diacylglycerol kinase [Niallia circulans]AST98092.1 diacylglycerol kinase [Shouchella clausii]MBU8595363.1 diacylglycerol kinase family protein [Shouchella clausii]MCM3550673.1 diacylglycerol kinase family protein [Shouchella clausii]
MGLGDRNHKGIRRFLHSFRYASAGLIDVIKHEQNMRIHLISGAVVLIAAWALSVSIERWLVLLLVVGGVLSLEVMNTAIERTVDLVTEEYRPLAKRAKDIAAASVFVFCIFAAVIGVMIFFPYLFELFQ